MKDFYDNKLSICPFSLVEVLNKLKIHVSVNLLTIRLLAR